LRGSSDKTGQDATRKVDITALQEIGLIGQGRVERRDGNVYTDAKKINMNLAVDS
jgi:hypothetical protein